MHNCFKSLFFTLIPFLVLAQPGKVNKAMKTQELVGSVYSIYPASEGKLYVLGNLRDIYAEKDSISKPLDYWCVTSLYRLNKDGSLDTTFKLKRGCNSSGFGFVKCFKNGNIAVFEDRAVTVYDKNAKPIKTVSFSDPYIEYQFSSVRKLMPSRGKEYLLLPYKKTPEIAEAPLSTFLIDSDGNILSEPTFSTTGDSVITSPMALLPDGGFFSFVYRSGTKWIQKHRVDGSVDSTFQPLMLNSFDEKSTFHSVINLPSNNVCIVLESQNGKLLFNVSPEGNLLGTAYVTDVAGLYKGKLCVSMNFWHYFGTATSSKPGFALLDESLTATDTIIEERTSSTSNIVVDSASMYITNLRSLDYKDHLKGTEHIPPGDHDLGRIMADGNLDPSYFPLENDLPDTYPNNYEDRLLSYCALDGKLFYQRTYNSHTNNVTYGLIKRGLDGKEDINFRAPISKLSNNHLFFNNGRILQYNYDNYLILNKDGSVYKRFSKKDMHSGADSAYVELVCRAGDNILFNYRQGDAISYTWLFDQDLVLLESQRKIGYSTFPNIEDGSGFSHIVRYAPYDTVYAYDKDGYVYAKDVADKHSYRELPLGKKIHISNTTISILDKKAKVFAELEYTSVLKGRFMTFSEYDNCFYVGAPTLGSPTEIVKVSLSGKVLDRFDLGIPIFNLDQGYTQKFKFLPGNILYVFYDPHNNGENKGYFIDFSKKQLLTVPNTWIVLPSNDVIAYNYIVWVYPSRTLMYLVNGLRPYKKLLSGNVYYDKNKNCQYDHNEKGVDQVLLQLEPTRELTSPAKDGSYRFYIDSSLQNLKIKQLPLSIDFLSACPSEINLSNKLGTDTCCMNFGNQYEECVNLEIGIEAERKRRCFTGKTTVNFRNNGKWPVASATIKVAYPAYLRPLTSQPAWKEKTDSTLVYELTNIKADSIGFITIKDSVICGNENIRGLTQCIKAFISPVSTCKSVSGLYQSDIKLSSNCVNGKAFFTIENTGASMVDSLSYRLYRNDSLWVIGKYQLARLGKFVLNVPGKGNSLRLEAEPKNSDNTYSRPVTFLEGCGSPNFSLKTGFVTSNQQDDKAPETAVVCTPITDSYDPNDKIALPQGKGPNNVISKETRLHYTIRFQNTGTDTAYNIEVIDTLDSNFDILTLKNEASSSKYRFEVSGKEKPVLHFFFQNINLVDSTTSRKDSEGYVQFSVQPKKEVSLGTVIRNKAQIYFDYNSPITTNETKHTIVIERDNVLIHDPVIVLSALSEPYSSQEIVVFPNPIEDKIHIRQSAFGKGIFVLTDLQNKEIIHMPIDGRDIILDRGDVKAGMYLYTIKTETENRVGKLMFR